MTDGISAHMASKKTPKGPISAAVELSVNDDGTVLAKIEVRHAHDSRHEGNTDVDSTTLSKEALITQSFSCGSHLCVSCAATQGHAWEGGPDVC